MREAWDKAELTAAMYAMREFENRCNEIANRIGEKRRIDPYERAELERLYKALKSDSKRGGKVRNAVW